MQQLLNVDFFIRWPIIGVIHMHRELTSKLMRQSSVPEEKGIVRQRDTKCFRRLLTENQWGRRTKGMEIRYKASIDNS